MKKVFLKGKFECFFCEGVFDASELYFDTQKRVCFCCECFESVYKDKDIIVIGSGDEKGR